MFFVKYGSGIPDKKHQYLILSENSNLAALTGPNLEYWDSVWY